MKISLGATLSELRKSKTLTQKALAERMSEYGFAVNNKSVYNWEKNIAQPSVPHFLALCDILGVDDALWTFAGIHSGIYAGLNQAGRKKAREFIDLLFHVDMYREGSAVQVEKPRLLRLYDIPVSAGTGNFLDESGYELIEAPGYIPTAADFALRVSGDSMEPLFQDGQVIWVKEQETLNSGDIGIFAYFDDVYCKKLVVDYDKVYLRSLNPDYEDIEILEGLGLKAIGKVV